MKHKEKSKPNYLFFGVVIVIVAVLGYFLWKGNSEPGKYDDFAQCLTESGAKMYGAWWCPHCTNQKTAFGKSWKLFGGYVECSNSDRTQTAVCAQAGITGYPTWRFGDGSELGGEVSFYTLSQKSGCELPTQ